MHQSPLWEEVVEEVDALVVVVVEADPRVGEGFLLVAEVEFKVEAVAEASVDAGDSKVAKGLCAIAKENSQRSRAEFAD